MNPIGLFHSNNRTIVAPPAGTPITYGSGAGAGTLTQSPPGTWGSGAGGAVHAVATQTIAASQNARYQADYLATNNRNAIIGWSDTNTNTDFTLFALGIFVNPSTGRYYYILNGSGFDTGISALPGDKYSLNRQGGASALYSAEYYRSGWISVFNYPTLAGVNVQIFNKMDLQSASIFLSNPTLL